MGPMLATCQNRYGKICSEERRSIDRSWFCLTRQLVVGPGKRRGSCATLSRETQAAKKKVVAGTVHWGSHMSVHVPVLCRSLTASILP